MPMLKRPREQRRTSVQFAFAARMKVIRNRRGTRDDNEMQYGARHKRRIASALCKSVRIALEQKHARLTNVVNLGLLEVDTTLLVRLATLCVLSVFCPDCRGPRQRNIPSPPSTIWKSDLSSP